MANLTYETHYANERQTVTVFRDSREVGAIQQLPSGKWLPRIGIGITSDLPFAHEKFPTPADAIAWITARLT